MASGQATGKVFMTDKEIRRLYKNGEQEKAFGEIVGNYSERLYWHVRRLVGSHEDADDLLQEIFIKVWGALPSFRWDSQLYTWLYRIATNESLNFLRKRQTRAALSNAQTIDAEMEKKVDDDPFFDGTAAQRVLMKAIARLPEKQRLVFTMRYFDDMKYDEISRVLGTSVGALKASYHFAYEKIKEELKKNF